MNRNIVPKVWAVVIGVGVLLMGRPALAQTPPPPEPLVYAQRYLLPSAVLGETRAIDVSLPESYHEAAPVQSYPVVVVLDGEFMFQTVTGIVRHLGSVGRMPEAIVVGIPNNTGKRLASSPKFVRDDGRTQSFGGDEEAYIQFFEQELFPYLKTHFRVVDFNILVGLSPTASFALHTFWAAPDLFQAHIALVIGTTLDKQYTPEQTMADRIVHSFAEVPSRKAYLYLGSAESNYNADVEAALGELEQRLLPYQNLTLKREVVPGSAYAIVLPAVMSAMDMIFPAAKWNPDYRTFMAEEGQALAHMDAFFENLSAEYGFRVYPKGDRFWNVNGLRGLGSRLRSTERPREAVEVFQRWVEYYPNAPQAYFHLAYALQADGQSEEALAAGVHGLAKAREAQDPDLASYENNFQELRAEIEGTPRKN